MLPFDRIDTPTDEPRGFYISASSEVAIQSWFQIAELVGHGPGTFRRIIPGPITVQTRQYVNGYPPLTVESRDVTIFSYNLKIVVSMSHHYQTDERGEYVYPAATPPSRWQPSGMTIERMSGMLIGTRRVYKYNNPDVLSSIPPDIRYWEELDQVEERVA